MSEVPQEEPVDTGVHQADIAANLAAQAVAAPEAPAQDEIEEPETDEQNDTEEPAPSDGNDAPAKPKNKGVGKRIDELTREKYDAIRERDYWREQAQRASVPQEAPHVPAPDVAPPTLAQYGYDEAAYQQALTEFVTKQTVAVVERKLTERQQQQTAQQIMEGYEKREREYAAAHPEYRDAYANLQASVRFDPRTLEVIALSDRGPEIVNYLGNDIDNAVRISRLPPHVAAAEIARIEAKVSTPASRPPPSVTKAPAPVPTLRPAAQIKKSLADMDMAEYEAERTRQRKAAGLIR